MHVTNIAYLLQNTFRVSQKSKISVVLCNIIFFLSQFTFLTFIKCQIWLGRLRISFEKVSKLFKCYVSVKNFDRKPAFSLKMIKIGFFNTLLTTRLNKVMVTCRCPLNLFYMAVRIFLYN